MSAARRLRVLVVAPEPVRGGRWTGPLIRAARIARHTAAEHDVTLAMEGTAEVFDDEPFKARALTRDQLAGQLDGYDVVVSQGREYPARLVSRSRRTDRPRQVFDLYTPVVFENLQADRETGRAADPAMIAHLARLTRLLLQRADYLICASSEQRDLLLGQLLSADWRRFVAATESVDRVIGVVPFGHDGGELPGVGADAERVLRGTIPAIGDDDPILLWGGGVWNWFDPLTLLRAVALLRERIPNVRLVFLGVRHPDGDFSEYRMLKRAMELSDELGLTDSHAFFNDTWVPFDERHRFLAESTLAVCTAPEGLENHFSFRTRLVDAVWAELPIICTRGGTMARFVEQTGGGVTVAGGDVEALAEAIADSLQPQRLSTMRAALRAHRDELAWTNALAPLSEYLRRVATYEDDRETSESASLAMRQYLAYKLPSMFGR